MKDPLSQKVPAKVIIAAAAIMFTMFGLIAVGLIFRTNPWVDRLLVGPGGILLACWLLGGIALGVLVDRRMSRKGGDK